MKLIYKLNKILLGVAFAGALMLPYADLLEAQASQSKCARLHMSSDDFYYSEAYRHWHAPKNGHKVLTATDLRDRLCFLANRANTDVRYRKSDCINELARLLLAQYYPKYNVVENQGYGYIFKKQINIEDIYEACSGLKEHILTHGHDGVFFFSKDETLDKNGRLNNLSGPQTVFCICEEGNGEMSKRIQGDQCRRLDAAPRSLCFLANSEFVKTLPSSFNVDSQKLGDSLSSSTDKLIKGLLTAANVDESDQIWIQKLNEANNQFRIDVTYTKGTVISTHNIGFVGNEGTNRVGIVVGVNNGYVSFITAYPISRKQYISQLNASNFPPMTFNAAPSNQLQVIAGAEAKPKDISNNAMIRYGSANYVCDPDCGWYRPSTSKQLTCYDLCGYLKGKSTEDCLKEFFRIQLAQYDKKYNISDNKECKFVDTIMSRGDAVPCYLDVCDKLIENLLCQGHLGCFPFINCDGQSGMVSTLTPRGIFDTSVAIGNIDRWQCNVLECALRTTKVDGVEDLPDNYGTLINQINSMKTLHPLGFYRLSTLITNQLPDKFDIDPTGRLKQFITEVVNYLLSGKDIKNTKSTISCIREGGQSSLRLDVSYFDAQKRRPVLVGYSKSGKPTDTVGIEFQIEKGKANIFSMYPVESASDSKIFTNEFKPCVKLTDKISPTLARQLLAVAAQPVTAPAAQPNAELRKIEKNLLDNQVIPISVEGDANGLGEMLKDFKNDQTTDKDESKQVDQGKAAAKKIDFAELEAKEKARAEEARAEAARKAEEAKREAAKRNAEQMQPKSQGNTRSNRSQNSNASRFAPYIPPATGVTQVQQNQNVVYQQQGRPSFPMQQGNGMASTPGQVQPMPQNLQFQQFMRIMQYQQQGRPFFPMQQGNGMVSIPAQMPQNLLFQQNQQPNQNVVYQQQGRPSFPMQQGNGMASTSGQVQQNQSVVYQPQRMPFSPMQHGNGMASAPGQVQPMQQNQNVVYQQQGRPFFPMQQGNGMVSIPAQVRQNLLFQQFQQQNQNVVYQQQGRPSFPMQQGNGMASTPGQVQPISQNLLFQQFPQFMPFMQNQQPNQNVVYQQQGMSSFPMQQGNGMASAPGQVQQMPVPNPEDIVAPGAAPTQSQGAGIKVEKVTQKPSLQIVKTPVSGVTQTQPMPQPAPAAQSNAGGNLENACLQGNTVISADSEDYDYSCDFSEEEQ